MTWKRGRGVPKGSSHLAAAIAAALAVGVGTAFGQGIGAPQTTKPMTPKSAEATLERLSTTLKAETPVWQAGDPVTVREDLRTSGPISLPEPVRQANLDVLLQNPPVVAPSGPQPTIAASFDAISATGFVPPDVASAVGPNHYVEMVNSAMAIYAKDGTLLLGPVDINSLWKGFGGPCDDRNSGDPIVRYDSLADRWMVSQFAIDEDEKSSDYQCIAVSKGSNPVESGWYLYAFDTADENGKKVFPDYPKIGVWPDGYYMGTQRGFPKDGLDVWVFERDKMIKGQPARQIHFHVAAPSLFLMPGDFDGPPPPAGAPEVFVRHVNGALFGGSDRLEVFEFKADWAQPTASTFKLVATMDTASYNATLCNESFAANCAPQPDTGQKLETLPTWLMWRAQYRNFGDYETLVVNHTVNADGKDRAGIRWYELRKPKGGTWFVRQQSTHSPDALSRWMGSIAMDGAGNIALGYSASSDTVHPGIRLATRRADDPLNIMAQGEMTLVNGTGSQTGFGRWGDYTTMDVDPALPCTFWYTNQYYEKTSDADWRTRAVQIRMPVCPSAPQ